MVLKCLKGQKKPSVVKNPNKKLEKTPQLEITKSVPDYMLVRKKTQLRRLKIVFSFQAFYYLTQK